MLRKSTRRQAPLQLHLNQAHIDFVAEGAALVSLDSKGNCCGSNQCKVPTIHPLRCRGAEVCLQRPSSVTTPEGEMQENSGHLELLALQEPGAGEAAHAESACRVPTPEPTSKTLFFGHVSPGREIIY
jgi:hypothetical protein